MHLVVRRLGLAEASIAVASLGRKIRNQQPTTVSASTFDRYGIDSTFRDPPFRGEPGRLNGPPIFCAPFDKELWLRVSPYGRQHLLGVERLQKKNPPESARLGFQDYVRECTGDHRGSIGSLLFGAHQELQSIELSQADIGDQHLR